MANALCVLLSINIVPLFDERLLIILDRKRVVDVVRRLKEISKKLFIELYLTSKTNSSLFFNLSKLFYYLTFFSTSFTTSSALVSIGANKLSYI